MRYGNIPRVHKWNKTETTHSTTQKNRPVSQMELRLPALDEPPPTDTIRQPALPIQWSGNRKRNPITPLYSSDASIMETDSPYTLSGDTTYRETPEERQNRIRRNTGKGAFITLIIGLNLAVLTGTGIVGLVLFGIAAILVLLTSLWSYLLSRDKKDDEMEVSTVMARKFHQILISGILLLVTGVVMLLLAVLLWSEILAVLSLVLGVPGIIMVLYGAIASTAKGVRMRDPGNSNRPQNKFTGFAYSFLLSVVAILALFIVALLILFLTF